MAPTDFNFNREMAAADTTIEPKREVKSNSPTTLAS
jgi:hypothetical protein